MELKIAQIQMPVTADREENIRCACDMVRQAGDIDMAVLPEMFCCPYDNACFRPYGEAEGGDALTAGNSVTTFETPWGVVGVCVCFDFRFTELSELMVLAGAKLVVVPAAFNMTTGPAHWELLFRQRAVDGQCYTVGTSPARDTAAGYVAWGHSIVCDPWGTVVRQCDETPQTVVTTLDMERVEAVRQQLPILSARRTDVYELRRK